MMYGYGNGMNGWGYALMIVATLMVAALVIAVLVIPRTGRRSAANAVRGKDAERILEQRFARGEIDQDEFQSRIDVLRSSVEL